MRNTTVIPYIRRVEHDKLVSCVCAHDCVCVCLCVYVVFAFGLVGRLCDADSRVPRTRIHA